MSDTPKRLTGKIIKLSPNGYGFINSFDLPFTRIFFHWSGLNPKTNFTKLKTGMRVTFEHIEYQDKGPRAIKIELL